MPGWSEGRLVSRVDWAPGLATLGIAADIEPFSPGQFVNLSVEGASDADRRSYSIASPPGPTLEFLVTEVAGGRLTPLLLGLALGARVLVERKPQGFFTLRWIPEARDLWMIATGTGLGPFLSILKSGELWGRFERVVVVHGTRESRHQAHRGDLDALAREHPGKLLKVAVVSREPSAVGALHGRVTAVLEDGRLERAAGFAIDAERSHVMLCGNPQMIEDVTQLLSTRGLRKHRVKKPGHITIEKYW